MLSLAVPSMVSSMMPSLAALASKAGARSWMSIFIRRDQGEA